MTAEILLSKPYQNADNALLDAQNVSNDTKETFHIIYTYGEGYEVVCEKWTLDRNYYHGIGGKKMFFDFITTVKPK